MEIANENPSNLTDTVIRLTRGAQGLSNVEDVRARASAVLGDDAPITVALRDKRISMGEWGMHPDNGDGDRTFAGTIALLYGMDKDTLHRIENVNGQDMETMVNKAAERTLRSLVSDPDVKKAIEAAQADAMQSPTAARVAALYRCALQAMNPNTGNALDAVIYQTELYSTLATLAEMRRASQEETVAADETAKTCPA